MVPSLTRSQAMSMPRCFGGRTFLALGRSACRDVHDSLGEGLRRFLREIVADAPGDVPMLVWSGKHLRVRSRVRVRRAVGVAFHRDGRHRDDRTLGKLLLELGVFFLALS